MIEIDVQQLDNGTYEVCMRCIVSVRPATGPEKNLFFATVGRTMSFGLTPPLAAAEAAAREMDVEIYRRNRP